ncbi:MAG: DUF302 domain-containing protein [Acidimicrobiia bacterium]
MKSFETTVAASLADVEPRVRAALAAQGFGVLTEIDVAATFRAKLGVERPALKILGACNPSFAKQALDIDPSSSLVLPCNVVLETTPDGTHVAIVDPRALMSDPGFRELAAEAAGRLRAVVDTIAAS